MAKDDDIRRCSADDLRAMRARGESHSDPARVRAMDEVALESAIAGDPDWRGIPADWHRDALPVSPGPKTALSLRLDPDVVAFFRAGGKGYQTRMNAVLRAYVRAAKARTSAE